MFKAQTTLDSYFKSKNGNSQNDATIVSDNNNKINLKYFYLKWTNKFSPECNAYWTDQRPSEINYIEQVKCDSLEKDYYYYICGYFPDYQEKKYNLGKEKTYKNISMLKSHLQKNIRKMDDMLAIPTCYHLMKLSMNDLIRRLSIIMLEDTELHECITTIVWLTVALSKDNFRIKKYMYEWILGVIYLLCKTENVDKLKKDKNSISLKNITHEVLSCSNLLNKQQLSILYSMLIRVTYGGMECDLNMIQQYVLVWKDRFLKNGRKMNNMILKPISIYVTELKTSDWDISAIDYHCSPKIIDFIMKKYPELNDDEIKSLIWTYSSSINARVPEKQVNETNLQNWNKIKDYVAKTQKYMLESN